MAFKCIFGFHNWDGCKCSDCNKTRDEEHDRSKDCERCSKCGKIRYQQHDFSKDCEICSKCGKTRENQHNWNGCICSVCKKTRDEQHDWSSDCNNCSKCDIIRENQHDWSKDCDKCSKCCKTRENHHKIKGCHCEICKKIHVMRDCKCANCKKITHNVGDNICTKCGRFILENIGQFISFKYLIFESDIINHNLLNLGVDGRSKLESELKTYNQGIGITQQQKDFQQEVKKIINLIDKKGDKLYKKIEKIRYDADYVERMNMETLIEFEIKNLRKKYFLPPYR